VCLNYKSYSYISSPSDDFAAVQLVLPQEQTRVQHANGRIEENKRSYQFNGRTSNAISSGRNGGGSRHSRGLPAPNPRASK